MRASTASRSLHDEIQTWPARKCKKILQAKLGLLASLINLYPCSTCIVYVGLLHMHKTEPSLQI